MVQVVDVNEIAVIAGAVSNMIIGALWYSPLLLGNMWMRLNGWDMANMKEHSKGAGKAYTLSFVSALIMAYVLAHVIAFSEASSIPEGAQGGFWMWLGFIAPATASFSLFERRKWSLWLISNGYYLVSTVVMGAIIAGWM